MNIKNFDNSLDQTLVKNENLNQIYLPSDSAIDEHGFYELAEAMPQLLWSTNSEGTINYINKRYFEYTGLDLSCVKISNWFDFIHSDDSSVVIKKWLDCLRSGRIFQHEFRIKRYDGFYHWFLGRGVPVFDERKNKIHRWIITATDIEEHKDYENSLKYREATYKLIADAGVILNSSLDYSSTLQQLCELIVPQLGDWCIVDIVKNIVGSPHTIVWHRDEIKRSWAIEYQKKYRKDWHSSPTVLRVLEYCKSELYENITEEMMRTSAQSEQHFKDFKKLGMVSSMAVPIIGNSGVLGAMTLISSDSGRHFSNIDLTLAEDIGRRAGLAIDKSLLYESERKAREIAENANKSKSTFLANMSHEIRTPLSALIGFNELLRAEDLTKEEREKYHDIIKRNGELLLHLIDDILDLSKVEAGHLTLECVKIPLKELINEITTFMKTKAFEKGLEFIVEMAGELPAEFSTDPLRLKQILNNVIGNAIKFTISGTVKVRIEMDIPRNILVFNVSDTGIGIRPQVQERLFQPFSQADASVTRKFGGTGLGLILSKKLAQGLGGDLYLQKSEEGQGATFVLEIADHYGDKPSKKPLVSAPSGNLDGRKILVVDDSIDNQILIEYILKMRGAEVDTAENGRIGVDKALSGEHDAVLMDVQMPVMDGHSATRILRENQYSRPIIALTAHAMQDDRQKCLEVGCTDYLTKPINANLLVQTINRHVE